MSSIPGPVNSSVIQAAQAQQTAGKARDRERTEETRSRRDQDLLELRVDGVETTDAIRKLPQNDSEQAEDEHRRQNLPHAPDDEDGDPPRIDLQA